MSERPEHDAAIEADERCTVAVSSAACTARNVMDCLIQCRATHVVWLPDTESGFLFETLRGEQRLKLVLVCRGGEAIPLAVGLMVAGQRPVVVIQSTGRSELPDCLTIRQQAQQ